MSANEFETERRQLHYRIESAQAALKAARTAYDRLQIDKAREAGEYEERIEALREMICTLTLGGIGAVL